MDYRSKLDDMQGKLYLHNKNHERVLNWKVENRVVSVCTDLDWYEIPVSEIDKFLVKFYVIDEHPSFSNGNNKHVPQSKSPITLVTQDKFKEINDILLKNIEDIKSSEKNIPRAAAINKQVNSIINLAKTEIEMVKVVQTNKRRSA